MQCPVCGYEMGPFEAECERCKRLKVNTKQQVTSPANQPPVVPMQPQKPSSPPSEIPIKATNKPSEIKMPPNYGLGCLTAFIVFILITIGA